ncbi:VOC family protein [Brevundimonas lenta]|uniref:Catechol 2,3-dioxygenase-like lactoylglutathione lyase family enzyme n=1 Tax=Brevundimonas lenta TaxID=424796 RepID=A0A7W6NP84_9CAUL|nr:VOC family protein [Brevundimonas lenta]MBB4082234.1 catechol 2,3-dioxygenase-like lactoylglutathione lyase family enzyme [Brevundimonas lenta]
MLKDRNSSAIVAVGDIDRARAFYQDILGLTLEEAYAESGVLGFRTGETFLIVYKSDYAGSNRANAVVWTMNGDLVDTVNELRAKGVVFDQYDELQGLDFKDGVYSDGPMKLAWFKDPDGNILHLNEGM